jgi:hypothetical protein
MLTMICMPLTAVLVLYTYDSQLGELAGNSGAEISRASTLDVTTTSCSLDDANTPNKEINSRYRPSIRTTLPQIPH